MAQIHIMGNSLINWPAVIKHSGDAELVYINDQAQWDDEFDANNLDPDDSDYLIDCSGNTFSLIKSASGRVELQLRGETRSLEDLLGLIKAHASQTGSCCVAKLYAPSFVDAFKMLKSINADDA